MKSFWDCLKEGFDSIAKGMASFNIFPPPLSETKYKLPKTDEEAFERDRKALESDWESVNRDLFGEG